MNGPVRSVGRCGTLTRASGCPVLEIPDIGDTYANDIDLAEADDRLAIGFDEALLVYAKGLQETRVLGTDATIAVAFSPTKPYLATANIRGSDYRLEFSSQSSARDASTLNFKSKPYSPGIQRRRRSTGCRQRRANPGLGSYES